MINKLIRPAREKYSNMKIRWKLIVLFFSVSLIPLLILGGFCFSETRKLLMDQYRHNLQSVLSQTSLSIDSQLRSYNQVINFLSFNLELNTAVAAEHYDSFELYSLYNYRITPLFSTVRQLSPGIRSITLYTDALPGHGSAVQPLKDLAEQEWFSKADFSKTLWFFHDNSLYCVKQLLDINNPGWNPEKNPDIIHIIVMKIDTDSLFQLLTPEQLPGVNILLSAKDQILYATDLESLPVSSSFETGRSSFQFGNQTYTLLSSSLGEADWTLFFYVPNRAITAQAKWITYTLFLMIAFCLLLVLAAGNFFSGKMTRDVTSLHDNMHRIEQGILEVTVSSSSKDEIGELIQGFSRMINQLKDLINKVYIAQIHEKELEMKALQAQINPHFFYNALSLINWRALRIHAGDICELAQLLSDFYRTTLNNGNTLTLLKNELLNIQCYIQIQLVMHHDSFDVVYQFDESLSAFEMPNLMLQPLVENAILHGIEKKEDGRGLLKIQCHSQDHSIIFNVSDNGVGIPPEVIQTLLNKDSKGYGIKNVNERAKLLYGEAYGLKIKSTPGEGTVFTLVIPDSKAAHLEP